MAAPSAAAIAVAKLDDIAPETATFDMVCAALQLLYATDTEHGVRNTVDRFLQRVQDVPQAWALADALLGQDPFANSETHQRVFFGALTMHNKLRYNFRDLKPEMLAPVREQLLRHISGLNARLAAMSAPGGAASKFSAGSVRKLVGRLCLAYAALIVQGPDRAQDAVATIGSTFPPSTHGFILLELLTALAEEAVSSRLRAKTQRREAEFIEGLRATSGIVLPQITALLQSGASAADYQLTEAAMRCFGAWACLVGLDPAAVAASPCIDYVLAAFTSVPQLESPAYDCLMDLVRAFEWERPEAHVALAKIFPAIMSLATQFDAATASDDSHAGGQLANLFVDFGVRAANILVCDVSGQAALESMKTSMLQLMLKVTRHPDVDIAGRAISFWLEVGRAFRGGLPYRCRELSADAAAAKRDAVRASLAPVFAVVLEAAIGQLTFPPDFDTLDKERKESFKYDFRYAIQDVLSECVAFQGSDAVRDAVSVRLQAEAGKWRASGNPSVGWQGTEAVLYALRCLGNAIDAHDSVLMPVVFAMLPTLPLGAHPDLRASAFRVVDRFSRWLSAHPPYCRPLFEFVVSQGLVPAAGAAAAPVAVYQETAALALQHLSSYTAGLLQADLLALPGRLNLLAMPVDNAARISEAVLFGIMTMSPGTHEAPLAALLAPIMTTLQRVAADPAAAAAAAAADGSLAALLMTRDGSLSKHAPHDLRMPEATAQRLLAEAGARGGVVTLDPSINVNLVCAELVHAQLVRLGTLLYESQSAAAMYKQANEAAMGPRPHHSATAEVKARDARVSAAAKEARDSFAAALLRLTEALWPAISAVAGAFKDHSHVRDDGVLRVISYAVRALDIPVGPLLGSIVEVTEALNAAARGSTDALIVAALLVSRFARNPALRPHLLGKASGMLNVVFARVGSCPQPHPAGFNDDVRMVEAALELSSVLLQEAYEELLPTPAIDGLVMFAIKALDMDGRDGQVMAAVTFLVNLMRLGRLPLTDIYPSLAAAAGVAAAAAGAGAGLGGRPSMVRQMSGHADGPGPIAGAGASPMPASVGPGGVPMPAATKPEFAAAAARRPRIYALLAPQAEALTKTVVGHLLRKWPEGAIKAQRTREGAGSLLFLLYSQYMPALEGIPAWTMAAFTAEGACAEPDYPTPEVKRDLVAATFCATTGGAASPQLTVACVEEGLLRIQAAARGIVSGRGGLLGPPPEDGEEEDGWDG